MDVGKDLVLDMYRKMHRIRCFEQKIKELITSAEIPGFLHVSIGEEATAVGSARRCGLPIGSPRPIAGTAT